MSAADAPVASPCALFADHSVNESPGMILEENNWRVKCVRFGSEALLRWCNTAPPVVSLSQFVRQRRVGEEGRVGHLAALRLQHGQPPGLLNRLGAIFLSLPASAFRRYSRSTSRISLTGGVFEGFVSGCPLLPRVVASDSLTPAIRFLPKPPTFARRPS